ncbi:MAG: hypothetical protein JF614_04030 [Acidobacteria bacterium]|nr:hypothetical protein [Acidobacteriota bacterium]
MRPKKLGEFVMLLTLLTAVAGAQQVTLPLTQYEDLRTRANPAAEALAPPPAPFALELADFDVTAGPVSARVAQTLRLTLYDDKWQTVPLGDPGSFIHADLAGVEGRVDASDKGWALHVRGRGRHEVRLESAVPVTRDETATRPTWRFGLKLPPAAVVRGRIAVATTTAVEEVEIDGAGQMSPQEGKAAGRPWSFVAVPGGEAHWTLSGRATLPARAQLPLRWEATSATATALTRTRLRVFGWIEARVAQGRLAELRVPIPDGLEVASVQGGAGWKMDGRTLVVTPLAPVEDAFAVELELTGEPRDAFATPLLLPQGSARTTLLAKAVLKGGDGQLSLADPGSLRTAGDADAARLPASLRSAEGKLYVVTDAARPPRWAAEWAERTEVLASEIDRLLVDVAVGEAGRASYQLWAEVRNRGAQQLTFVLPAGFELASARDDGAPVTPGTAAGGGLSVPLLTQEATQVVHLSGLLPLALPRDDGRLEVPLPALSAPAARIEVRVVLPGGRSYKLADAARNGTISAPPGTAPRKPAAGMARQVDAQVNSALRSSPAPAAVTAFFAIPPGFTEIRAAWSALSATPAPLALRAEVEKERPQWF